MFDAWCILRPACFELLAACYVLRAACCELLAACCVLRSDYVRLQYWGPVENSSRINKTDLGRLRKEAESGGEKG